jgi:hypothetical protein
MGNFQQGLTVMFYGDELSKKERLFINMNSIANLFKH